MSKVIVIGAGIGGIATANLLAKAGYDVHVYEQGPTAGGRAGLIELDGFIFDSGPSWYLMPEVFAHYFSLLNENIDDWLSLKRLDPAYKVFFEAKAPITITSDLATDSATFEHIEKGAGAALESYVKKSEHMYRMSLKHFLYTNFETLSDLTHTDILKNAPSLLRMTTRSIDSYVSSYVSDQRLKQILEYPMVFLGTSPFSAPALYSLMSALDFKEGVFYPKGGIYTIIQSLVAMSKKLSVTYHYNSPVSAIQSSEGKATAVQLENDSIVKADIVVSNADMHYTETKLLKKQDRSFDASYWKKKQPGPSALLMYLGVSGKIPEFEHHNLLFVDEWQHNFDAIYTTKTIPKKASIYISTPSKTDPAVAPKGCENVFVLVPLPASIDINDADLESLSNHYIEQIAVMTGVDLVNRLKTKRLFGPNDFGSAFNSWQNSMLGQSHLLKQSAFFRTPNKSRKLSNLYYVGGNTVPGVGLPMCLIGAELVYKRIAGNKKGGQVASIERLVDSHD